jgi:hypothetical protein
MLGWSDSRRSLQCYPAQDKREAFHDSCGQLCGQSVERREYSLNPGSFIDLPNYWAPIQLVVFA